MIDLSVAKFDVETLIKIATCIDAIDFSADSYEELVDSLLQIVCLDDLERILSTLQGLNKKKVSFVYKIVCGAGATRYTKKPENDITYSKGIVLELFAKHSDEELKTEYTFSVLKMMYDALYYVNGKKPLTPKSKGDIIKNIRNYIYSIERAKMFK